MVPEGWSYVEAKDICQSISVGVVIKPSQYYVSEEFGVKAFRSANVREGFINDSGWVYFSQKGHELNKKSQLKSGDVLIVRSGYPGTACVVTPDFEGSNAIDIVIARPDQKKVLPEYLCAYTNSSIGKSQVLNLQGGMAQKHLNVGAYQTLKVKLPTLIEQKKIAQIFSGWDQSIAITEKLLANSQQQKKALMQQLLTGKRRCLGFDEKWKEVAVGATSKCFSGGTPAKNKKEYYSGNIPWITSGKLNERFIDSVDKYISDEGLKNSSAKVVNNGCILVAMYGATAGKVAINQLEGATINQAILALEPESDYLNLFLFYLLENEMNKAIKLVQGGQPNLNASIVKGLKIQVPSKLEQQKIVEMLSAADAKIQTLQQKLTHLKQEKKSLMQQLLTGKRRVKPDPITQPTETTTPC